MIGHGPFDQAVREGDDRGGRTSGIRQFRGFDAPFGEEISEKLRTGGGEGFKDGLVGIAHAHPISVFAGEFAEDDFLEAAGVLGLVFEDVGPAGLEALEEGGVAVNALDGEADEVVEVYAAAVGEGALVVAVEVGAEVGEGEGGVIEKAGGEGFGGELEVFGAFDEGEG